eukprot:4283908-Amphidinium_carterae.1
MAFHYNGEAFQLAPLAQKPWAEEVDDPRQHALMAWLRIIAAANTDHCMVGRQLRESDAERMESLVDTLA